jgi:hypothetical protein
LIGLELVCLAIVASYGAARLFRANGAGERRAFLARFLLLAVAGFVGEDSVIRAYGYYAYATGWSARLDHVPLVIVLVWPVVIDSAATLARFLAKGGAARVASLGAVIVLADASLIEPIAVRAGLWRWTEPGLFAVPLIGIAGWAFFAWGAIFVLERARGLRKVAVIVLAPALAHVLILASYEVVFRAAPGVRSGAGAAALAWLASLVVVLRSGLRGRGLAEVPVAELLVRLPGAAFFFVLLGLTLAGPRAFAAPDARSYAAPDGALSSLLAYAAAFAPPYLAALGVRAARSGARRATPGAGTAPREE